jgi:hypothetical protein
MALHEFERRLERLVEGVFAKAFRSGLQPVELVRRLTREMDLGRTRGVRGVIAPNYFGFALSPDDHARFQAFADVLVRDLADAARDHARSEGYLFVGPVDVELVNDAGVSAGTFLLASEVREAEGGELLGTVVLPGGERVRVHDDAVTIGRLPECEVTLNDQNVSRRHAEVRKEGDAFVVVDLGSTNGTKVNGTRVQGQQRLDDGDEITVGSSTLRFEAS